MTRLSTAVPQGAPVFGARVPTSVRPMPVASSAVSGSAVSGSAVSGSAVSGSIGRLHLPARWLGLDTSVGFDATDTRIAAYDTAANGKRPLGPSKGDAG